MARLIRHLTSDMNPFYTIDVITAGRRNHVNSCKARPWVQVKRYQVGATNLYFFQKANLKLYLLIVFDCKFYYCNYDEYYVHRDVLLDHMAPLLTSPATFM